MGLSNNLGKLSNMITSTGSAVGIAQPSPSYTLDITGTSRISGANYLFTLNGGGTSRIAGTIGNTSGTLDYGLEGSAGGQLFTGAAAYSGNIGTSSATSFNLCTNSTVRTTIGSDGVTKFLFASDRGIRMKGTLSSYSEIAGYQVFTENIRELRLTGSTLQFYTGDGSNSTGSERMRVTEGGSVGIGTSAPSNRLHVKSDIANDWLAYFEQTNAAIPAYNILIQFTAGSLSTNSSGSYAIYSGDPGSQRFSVRGNGGIYNFQANDSNLSDIRTKKDIIPLESYWDKFKAIEIVKFKYIDQTHDDFNIGVIAQQVEEIAPEFVDTDYWENPLNEDKTEMKSVFTTDLYHATIKVLQEAMTKIEELSSQNQDLKSRLDKAGL